MNETFVALEKIEFVQMCRKLLIVSILHHSKTNYIRVSGPICLIFVLKIFKFAFMKQI